nr:rRNA methyltransferase 1, mitochondrial [Tanacetum cinerariifolium]
MNIPPELPLHCRAAMVVTYIEILKLRLRLRKNKLIIYQFGGELPDNSAMAGPQVQFEGAMEKRPYDVKEFEGSESGRALPWLAKAGEARRGESSERYTKSGKEKIRRKDFRNGSKSVEGDSGIKKDVRSSWEVSAEKFVKSGVGVGDMEKGRSFDERNDFRERNGKFAEKGRNFDERSNGKFVKSGFEGREKGRSFNERNDFRESRRVSDDESDIETEEVEHPKWYKIQERFDRFDKDVDVARNGNEFRKFNRQDEWGKKVWKEASESSVPRMVGEWVVLCAKNSAPLSGVVSKASAGSLELTELRSCKNMMQFLVSSAENGWRVIGGSVAPRAVGLNEVTTGEPTILVLGSEGTGLRPLVERSCTQLVKIPGNIPVHLGPGLEDAETEGLQERNGKFAEKGKNFDERSNGKFVKSGFEGREKGRSFNERNDFRESRRISDDESDIETEEVEHPKWYKIQERFDRFDKDIDVARNGNEFRKFNRQDEWGKKVWKEASESSVPRMVGECVYGVGPVLAALSANRREFYVLPHQGLVLDASPLEMVNIRELDRVVTDGDEESPLWLALDEVMDPQNLGAIISVAAGVLLHHLVGTKNTKTVVDVQGGEEMWALTLNSS